LGGEWLSEDGMSKLTVLNSRSKLSEVVGRGLSDWAY
jgi:hypothetical protein